MTQKRNNIDQQNQNYSFEVIQGKFLQYLGYVLLAFAAFSLIAIRPDCKLPSNNIESTSAVLLFFVMLLFVWIFLIVPYILISTKRKIIVNYNSFRIISNKNKYVINTTFDKLQWWQKISGIETGDYLQLKFESKRIDLSNYEFTNLEELENLLKCEYNHKKRSSR